MKWNYPCIENSLEREPCSYITQGSGYLHYPELMPFLHKVILGE